MKDTKRRVEPYLFYDFAGIARHLERMAARGWRLERITRFFWHYRRAPAKKLTYAVTYFDEASEFNATDTYNQHTFLTYCAEAGWTRVATMAQMQVFVSEDENPTPLETDPALQLETIHRAMWKNFLPGNLVLIALFFVQLLMRLHWMRTTPVRFWGGGEVFAAFALLMIVLSQTVPPLGYAFWRRRAKRSVADGGGCPATGSGPVILQYLFLAAAVLGICAQFAHTASIPWWYPILLFVGLLGIYWIADRLRDKLRQLDFSHRDNIFLTGLATVLLTLAFLSGAARLAFRLMPSESSEPEQYTYSYAVGQTRTVTLGQDELPLTAEDLGETLG